jgi:hypothetical protein
MASPRKRLGELLVEAGAIDSMQLQAALGYQRQWGGKLGSVLVDRGFISEGKLVSALATQLAMPVVQISKTRVDPRAVALVPENLATQLRAFPLEVKGPEKAETLVVAMSDPTDLAAIDQIQFRTRRRVQAVLAGDRDVNSAIRRHYRNEDAPPPPDEPVQQQLTGAEYYREVQMLNTEGDSTPSISRWTANHAAQPTATPGVMIGGPTVTPMLAADAQRGMARGPTGTPIMVQPVPGLSPAGAPGGGFLGRAPADPIDPFAELVGAGTSVDSVTSGPSLPTPLPFEVEAEGAGDGDGTTWATSAAKSADGAAEEDAASPSELGIDLPDADLPANDSDSSWTTPGESVDEMADGALIHASDKESSVEDGWVTPSESTLETLDQDLEAADAAWEAPSEAEGIAVEGADADWAGFQSGEIDRTGASWEGQATEELAVPEGEAPPDTEAWLEPGRHETADQAAEGGDQAWLEPIAATVGMEPPEAELADADEEAIEGSELELATPDSDPAWSEGDPGLTDRWPSGPPASEVEAAEGPDPWGSTEQVELSTVAEELEGDREEGAADSERTTRIIAERDSGDAAPGGDEWESAPEETPAQDEAPAEEAAGETETVAAEESSWADQPVEADGMEASGSEPELGAASAWAGESGEAQGDLSGQEAPSEDHEGADVENAAAAWAGDEEGAAAEPEAEQTPEAALNAAADWATQAPEAAVEEPETETPQNAAAQWALEQETPSAEGATPPAEPVLAASPEPTVAGNGATAPAETAESAPATQETSPGSTPPDDASASEAKAAEAVDEQPAPEATTATAPSESEEMEVDDTQIEVVSGGSFPPGTPAAAGTSSEISAPAEAAAPESRAEGSAAIEPLVPAADTSPSDAREVLLGPDEAAVVEVQTPSLSPEEAAALVPSAEAMSSVAAPQTSARPAAAQRGWEILGLQQPTNEDAVNVVGALVDLLVSRGTLTGPELLEAIRSAQQRARE